MAVGNSAHALNVGLQGGTTGSVQVGGGTEVQSTTSVQSQGPSYVNGSINVGVGAQATTSARSQNSANMNGSANINLGVGLQAQIQAVAANTSSVDAVVQLEGNTAGLIQSDADLSAYNNLVIKERPVVTAINVRSDNGIAIDYSQPAKLFGIFSTSLSGEVDVDAQGNTTVHLPWYAIFYAQNSADIQTSVAAAVQQFGASFGAQVNGGAKIQDQAHVINAATASLQTQIQGRASASASY